MIGIRVALSLLLSGSLIVSTSANGQEPPRAEPPAKDHGLGAGARADAERAVVEVNELIFANPGQVVGQVGASKNQDAPGAAIPPALKLSFDRYRSNLLTMNQDALEANFGLTLSEADDALRSQLEIPPGQGVVVVGVKPGSLAEHAGLKVSDVLLSLGDQKTGEVPQAKKILLGLGKEALEVKLIREGKARRMSLVGPKHGFPPEAAEYWIGVPVSPIDSTLRAHLPTLAAEAGLVVNDVVKGSPADASGVQKNDILVTMGGKPLKTPDDLIEQIQAAQGKSVPLEILRVGKPMTITVTPARRAHPTTINALRHDGLSYRVVRPNVGIELGAGPTYRLSPADGQTIYRAFPELTDNPSSKGDQRPIDLQLRLNGLIDNKAGESTARIEAQLKEISAKIEEIRKSIDGLKKTEGK